MSTTYREKIETPGDRFLITIAAEKIQNFCHGLAREAGWWNELPPTKSTICEKLLLIHTEISEATEGLRKDLMDDKLPSRKMVEVELADAVIRCMDLAGAMRLDLGGAIAEKLLFNVTREDHRPENRALTGGKSF